MKTILFILALLPALCFGQSISFNNNVVSIDASGNIVALGSITASSNTFARRYIVGEKGNFTTLKAAITWLSTGSNMTGPSEILLDGDSTNIADSIGIQLNYPVIIRGGSYGTSYLNAATGLTGKPMFNIRSECYFYSVKFDGTTLASWGNNATENIINTTITISTYLDIQNCYFKGGYTQINQTGATTSFLFNSYFEAPVRTAITINSTGATNLDCEVNTFTSCPIGINLQKSTSGDFIVQSNIFSNRASPSDTAIKYVPATYIYTDGPVIALNKYNNLGVFVTGVDYTRSDGRDANIFDQFNIGRENKNPHCKVNCLNNATTTTVTTGGTFYKANFTNSATSYTCKWTLANNRITYQPVNRRDAWMIVSCNVLCNVANRNVDIAIVKNGNTVLGLFGQMTTRITTANQATPITTPVYVADMAPGDYLEIWVTSSNNGDVLTVQDVSWYADTH